MLRLLFVRRRVLRTFMCLGVVSVLFFAAVDSVSAWSIVQLTDNDFDDTMPQVSGNNIAWMGGSGSEIDVFLYDGAIRQLTDGSFNNNGSICIDGNCVAWTGWKTSGNSEVFLFDGQTTNQITNNDVNDIHPALWNGGVAWISSDGSDDEVFIYDGVSTMQLTDDSYEQYSLDASGQYVGWITNDGNVCHVMRYDGQTVTQVTEDPVSPYNGPTGWIKLDEDNILLGFRIAKPLWRLELYSNEERNEIGEQFTHSGYDVDISGSRVVWDSGTEIFIFNGNELIQLTDNNQEDYLPCVSDSMVAWCGSDGNDYEIFLYDGNNVIQLTDNDCDDWCPRMSESTLVWQHWDGNDWEIQMVSVPEPNCVCLLLVGLVCCVRWCTFRI